MDPAISLLQEAAELTRQLIDAELSTPLQDPTSPFPSPPSTSNSLYIMNSNQQLMSSDERVKRLALRSQDADHRRRFERFLNDSGVKRQSLSIIHTTDELNSIVHNLLDNELPDDEDDSESIVIEEHEDFDNFYRDHAGTFVKNGPVPSNGREDIDVVGNDDSDFTYVKSEYSNTGRPLPVSMPPLLPLNLQDSYLFWEQKPVDQFEQEEITVQFSSEPQWAVKRQPLIKFRDSLRLGFDGLTRLDHEYGKKYKNNLSCFSNQFQLLFTASNSEIFGYRILFDNKPCKTPVIRFDTKPSFITERDRNSSTWPYFPFTINYMKIDKFLDKEVLAIACDDGRVLIWFVELLHQQIPNFEMIQQQRMYNNGIYGIRVHPDFQLRVECSAWSVDFYNKYNMIAISDNSQSVSLFYLEESAAKFYSVTSHLVLHNIPDIAFIKDDDVDQRDQNVLKIRISCASIRCELVVFEFTMYLVYGPFMNRSPATESADEKIIFDPPVVVNRTLLSEDVWTVNFIDGKYFKRVNSLKSMCGDQFVDEELEVNKIIRQNEKLDVESDPCLSSDLGLVAKFQFFQIPTETLHGGDSHYSGGAVATTKNFSTMSDRYRRIRKMFDSYYLHKQRSKLKSHKSLNGRLYWEPVVKTKQNNKFLCVTSSSKLGLFNSERLLCVSSTPTSVFDFNLSFGEEASYSNRLSISCLIPELSCIVIGSQIGLVSIFRMCTYRGCYGLRQEFVFPNASRLALGDRGYRTITGLCVRKVDKSDPIDRNYIIYITYIDGLVLCYSVNDSDDGLQIGDTV